jgi:hypothetical protein
MTGGSHVDAQSNEIGNGVSCNHAQSSDCLPHMVVRHLNSSSRAFTLCLHGSRIALFSAALAVQIFGRKERVTVVTLSVECFIIVFFMTMGAWVMRLFSRNDDVNDVDASTEKNPPLTGSQHDIEQGSGT